ncbi:MAG: hypothetical protein IMY77_01185 [Chloroflexi bacterium]|nr:hypothetical protein [Chloroflexota bacterium]
MKKSSDFENILDACLERLVKGETVEQCLESYPELAVQLEPLLRTAQAAREVSAILPRAEFKARARYEFRSALQAATTKRRLPLFGLRRGWVMALMIVSILLVSGGGTAAAASNSMPDSRLYPVKLATEQVQLALTPSDMGKARLCTVLADKRIAEIIYMADKGDAQCVEVITQRLDERLTELTMLVSASEAGDTPQVLTEVPAEPPSELPEESTVAPPVPSEEVETVPVPAPVPSDKAIDDSNKGDSNKDDHAKNNNRAKLRVAVAVYAADHPAALRAELRRVPASVRPALRRAISVSEAGYKKALAALD